MLLEEALVIFACTTSNGCSQTSDEYFRLHPEVKVYAEKRAQQVRKYIGPQLVDTCGPILFVSVGGTGIIRLHEHVGLQLNKQTGTLILNWSY